MATVIKEMPLSNDVQNYKFTIKLLGTLYTIRIKYNYRMSRWFFDLRTVDDEAIVAGLPLVLGCDILQNYRSKTDVPAGVLVMENYKETNTEIDKTALGVDGFLNFIYDDGE